MFGHTYNHGAIRKYIIMFGNMFNDINVVRYNNAGEAVQAIRVPIAYGPREKFLSRLDQDPTLSKQVAIQLPRLSFEITNMSYSPNRALNKMVRNSTVGTGSNSLKTQFTPVPYDINIQLSGMFANQEDAVQVVEQILPFFRPEWTNSVKIVPEIGDYYDVPTVLNSMSIEDTYDSDYQTRRAIIYTFDFTVKGYIFGPVSNRGVIKRTIIDITNNADADPIGTETGPQKKLILTPGLLANGQPTSNSAASVALSSITANANFGYAFDSDDYFDGINRHEH
jgi:hypothetical protein